MPRSGSVGHLEIDSVSRSFGSLRAVNAVSLDIAAGEFIAFLGPSGCGKTTLLRIIAGFEAADSGRLTLDGRVLAGLPPNRRDVGMVFQNLALFPHLTVAENVAFGLELRRKGTAEIARQVEEALALVALDGLAGRRIQQLSGGQRQRVALARALVLHPAVLLLDEPLSALDLKLRRQLQGELKALQRRTGTTFVFVTHDQEEALSMADRVAVFNRGGLEQFDTPQALYGRPATRFVAEFVGDANIRSAAQLAPLGLSLPAGSLLVIRPEDCVVGTAAAAAPVRIDGVVEAVDFVGPHARLRVAPDGMPAGTTEPWLALLPGAALDGLAPGARATLGFDPARAAQLPASQIRGGA
ncbi:ABC transporter ATP-binding protein [Pararoseomonas indoligenes]|uniref:ABC transporter ATP-binding protein n=1 Tax=Roseomonas indoligenes TaxID=2820811 RepID=A0A940SAM3_9PROT|nr:ABC transporter ATP-binding protein [Pararoseomonas indoligenes]MBP0496347.1 ABC transporter ATP-binding protein [Pararoseomonas indoligenes]